jgi:SAM-dependent methyltransferase
MAGLKTIFRSITRLDAARPLQMWYRRNFVLPRTHKRYASMTTAEVFAEIYAKKEWNEDIRDEGFDSGLGSGSAFASRYCDLINDFIETHKIQSVVDLGCGDFRVGRQIARPGILYTGVDLVSDLIEYNQKTFGADHIRFQSGDLTSGPLPDGELCLIRQVLQHLSNQEILTAIERCEKYPYVIVTEHIPKGGKIKPNVDKPHGPDIRLYWNSGVFLEQPPFLRRTTTLLDVPHDRWSVLRTSLVERSASIPELRANPASARIR